jgi:hypothetical protein
MKTVFLRVIEAQDKPAALLAAIRDSSHAVETQRFDVGTDAFGAIPRTPFAYWVAESMLTVFRQSDPFESKDRFALGGLKTLNDDRFVRLKWELFPGDDSSWPRLAKGGAFSRFYADVHLCVNWKTSGREISWYGYQRRPREGFGAASRGAEAYFRPGLTWPRRTQGGLSLRAMPRGCIFADKGPAAFSEGDKSENVAALLAIVNSTSFRSLVDLQMAFGSYEVGVIQRTPVPDLPPAARDSLAASSAAAWRLKRALDTRTENSHAFLLPAQLQMAAPILADRAIAWADHVRTINAELAHIQAEIDDLCFDLYGIDEADRKAITESFGAPTPDDQTQPTEDDEEEAEEQATADAASLTAELLSWTLGTAFGRFDVRLATGERQPPPEPEPFDPLPRCSPGMLTGDDGLPLDKPPPGYPIPFPESGVLVDDPGHALDLTARSHEVFAVVFPADTEERWQEAAALIDPRGADLRAYFQKTFFEQHIKRYSKSRRKAPIYWQLGPPSASYSVWLYLHRFHKDTLHRVLDDVLTPKLNHEQRRLDLLRAEGGPSPTGAQRLEIEQQETLVDELRSFREELARVTPLWNPELDDGVVLNAAPLWRLFGHTKPWQKECRAKWDELCAGKYDWAHLAMRLWPERVVPKCLDDRSLAIAHGLEEAFWQEDEGGKWTKRAVSDDEVARLVAERSKPAVKAALKSLLDAGGQAPAGGPRGRRPRAKGTRAAAAPASAAPKGDLARKSAHDEEVLAAILGVLRASPSGTAKAEVVAQLGLSNGQWSAAIQKLSEEGRVERTGKGRGVRYRLAGVSA